MRKRWIAGGWAALGTGLAVHIWVQVEASALASRERAASSALKALASAEADFRGNDRDGNRVQDFWTGDVAGLYYLPDRETKKPIALIEKDVADADAKPVRSGASSPKGGYYFVAMSRDETDVEYAGDTQGDQSAGPNYNHAKFGFCAYPADYPRSGRWTFMINEGNTVFRIDTGGKPVTRWPADDSPKDPRFGGA